ncbi:TcaA NTF2-like domain-containing protein [Planococcus sp. X10-3]|uniref:TcaA NTF2-like domain-containing protein n=1 Tax=Planococcus sp. X10-3 TaxID=3061240 RepID=UPI003BB1AC83
MKKFCTNCGHANNQDNKICVECGTSLTGEKKVGLNSTATAQPVKSKTPLSLKTKILSIVGVLLVASLIGVYSWGTKTASADTVVTKFFEALQNEDAEALSKQTWLSNGQAMSVKEAGAFIDRFHDITPYELENVAKVEKNGKVIGIFDAHRIVIPAQQLSFHFPHEGLALSLNGELVTAVKHADGEYFFSDVSPGFHEAEFIFEGEFAEFNFPFELDVALYADSSAVEPIYVDLPVSSVTFGLETFYEKNPDANNVIIGDKKIPVGEYGETEGIGPLLLDGSTTAQAQIAFPWGTQVSEPVEITSTYHTFTFSGLDEEQQTALKEQLLVFAEEYVQAYALRDSKIFTGVTKNQLSVFKEDLNQMKNYDNYFKGSLVEVGVDEESIIISSDGETVQLDAEFTINGDYYYESDTPDMDELLTDISIDFIYDESEKKWLVNSFSEDNWFLSVVPTVFLEGSGKVYASTGTAKTVEVDDVEESEDGLSLSEEDAEFFMNAYNDASVKAINSGDILNVAAFIYDSGPRYKEQSDFIDYMYSEGITEEHLGTSIESVKHLEKEFYEVVTIEEFIIHGTESSNEKTYRTVTKVRVDDSGAAVYELISTKEI